MFELCVWCLSGFWWYLNDLNDIWAMYVSWWCLRCDDDIWGVDDMWVMFYDFWVIWDDCWVMFEMCWCCLMIVNVCCVMFNDSQWFWIVCFVIWNDCLWCYTMLNKLCWFWGGLESSPLENGSLKYSQNLPSKHIDKSWNCKDYIGEELMGTEQMGRNRNCFFLWILTKNINESQITQKS